MADAAPLHAMLPLELPIEIWRMVHFNCAPPAFGRFLLAFKDLSEHYRLHPSLIDEYKIGRLEKMTEWDRRGRINGWDSTRTFTRLAGKRHGLYTETCRCNAFQRSITTRVMYVHGFFHGRLDYYITYDVDDVCESFLSYDHGVMHGKAKLMLRTKDVICRENFRKGLLDGMVEHRREGDGSLKVLCNYVRGKVHGPFKTWKANGTLRREFTFHHGRLHSRQFTYRNGQKIGARYYYGQFVKGHKIDLAVLYKKGSIQLF